MRNDSFCPGICSLHPGILLAGPIRDTYTETERIEINSLIHDSELWSSISVFERAKQGKK